MEIQGIAAIVTGGASGLGQATARALAASGARVALFDLNEEAGAATAEEIGGLSLKCDVSSEQSAIAAIEQAAAAHGVARLVVNCAGIAPGVKVVGRDGPHPLEIYRKVIEVNLIGTFNILRLTAAAMQGLEPVNEDGERGLIINTASVAAFEGQLGQAAYSSSKGGVVGLTLPAARELAKSGIRVVTIAPGILETPMFKGMKQEVVDALVAKTLFPKRLGKPEEYAKMVLAIADNPLINGETIRLDGAIRLEPR